MVYDYRERYNLINRIRMFSNHGIDEKLLKLIYNIPPLVSSLISSKGTSGATYIACLILGYAI